MPRYMMDEEGTRRLEEKYSNNEREKDREREKE